MIIWSLKAGYVEPLITELQSNPRNLEVRLRGDRTLTAADIAAMISLPGIGYIAPTTRGLALRVFVGRPGELSQSDASLLPSSAGDPLLQALEPPAGDTVIVTRDVVRDLGLKIGDMLEVRAIRYDAGDILRIPLRVTGELAPATLAGRRLLVQQSIILDIEDFVDGYAVPAHNVGGRPPSERPRTFANARIYADKLESVTPLVRALEDLGNVPESDEAAIASALALQSGTAMLALIFALTLSIGAAISVWSALGQALIPQKRVVALFRLMGGTRFDVVAFVALIDLCIMLSALLIASAGYTVARLLIESRFHIEVHLPLQQAIATAVAVVAAALIIGMAFAYSFMAIDMKEALSNET
ncbi:hypothetical protein LB518_22045 [Mesorhizobium sp. BR1-1-16]|uniref:hypothetical protein n=1 Tax=Mesorhizobium sp. BR1-1-16 TaxID=2876653 RepID=UPI001CC9539E|nr:hypothetical protein [Mesorhizobium sp. BR1-1-16]MBZ9938995.1 hypothetical protein [Mesorhizobium sp. BR1-1-16]